MKQLTTNVVLAVIIIMSSTGYGEGLFRRSIAIEDKRKDECVNILTDKDFVKKMVVLEYREYQQRMCKKRSTKGLKPHSESTENTNYSSNKTKNRCAKILADPDFIEKMEVLEYREYQQRVCKKKRS